MKNKNYFMLIICIAMMLAQFNAFAQTENYAIDRTYGTDCGVTQTSFSGTIARPVRSISLPDGSVITVSITTSNPMGISKLNADGTIAYSVTYSDDYGLAAHDADYMDGKIYVVGNDYDYVDHLYRSEFAIFDASNGAMLVDVNDFSCSQDLAAFTSVVAQPNGQAVCIGGASGYCGTYQYLKRFNSNGTIDNSYGGAISIPGFTVGFFGNFVSHGIYQSNGKTVFGFPVYDGSTNASYLHLIRFTSTGAIDNTFTDGVTTGEINTNVGVDGWDMKVNSSDKIRIGTNGNNPEKILQYTVDGMPDATWGTNGVVTLSVPGLFDLAIDDATDKTLLFTYQYGAEGVLTSRYNANGTLDNTFGSGGSTLATNNLLGGANLCGYIFNSHRFGYSRLGIVPNGETLNGTLAQTVIDLTNTLQISSTFSCPNYNLSITSNNLSCFTFQWYKNGVAIFNATGTSCATTSDVANGDYYVIGTYSGGTNQSNTITISNALPIWYADADADGYGNLTVPLCNATQPTGYVANNTDCNDANNSVHPGAPEICDGIDNNCDGIIESAAADVNGTSLAFLNNAVTVPNSPGINPGLNMTVECWARSNTSTWNSYGMMINKQSPLAADFILHPYKNTKAVLFIIYSGSNSGAFYYDPNNSFDITQWHHYAGTYNGTTGILNCYVDGELVGQGTLSGGGPVNSTGDLHLGWDSYPYDGGRYLNGGIDEVRLWNIERSQCEIRQTMNMPLTGTETGLIAYYNFNNPAVTAGGNNAGETVLADLATSNGAQDGTLYYFALTGTSSNWVSGHDNIPLLWYQDNDGDLYGNSAVTVSALTEPCLATCAGGDCNDNTNAANPVATEICDGIDNDCDSQIDEGLPLYTFYADADGDGFGNPSSTSQACGQPSGYVSDNSDCNDASNAVHPGATETCNSIDDNCNSSIDEGVQSTFYSDQDGDSYGNSSVTTQACSAPSGYVSNSTDCNDNSASVHPGASETCNSIDDNCNGQTDEGVLTTFYRDQDGDGYGNGSPTTQACSAPSGYVSNSTDCNDNSVTVHPGATETCNSIDDNCNGQTDEGVLTTFYRDQDGDGYGNASVTTQACSVPSGYVFNSTDCNDNSASIHPGATETCANNIDDNCNGQIDEGCGGCSMTVDAGTDVDTYYGYSGGQTITRTAAVTGGTGTLTYTWTLFTYPGTPVARPLMCNNINNAGDESFYISNSNGNNICNTSGATCTNNTCPSSGSPTSAPVLSGTNAARVTMTLLDSAIVRVTVTDGNNCTATDDFIVRAEDVRCWSGNNQKIKICHKTGSQSNPCVTICIDESAWSAHQAHGDFIGKCNATCTAREDESVEISDGSANLLVYPNPTNGKFVIDLSPNDASNDDAIVQVTNTLGQIIFDQKIPVTNGELQKEIQLNDAAAGMYYVNVIAGGHQFRTQVAITK
ncbi:MAG TPA: MopE-related protein [Chitinophagales bacterium]|nr:MopE-related protein [Chitinophagales bacterium]